MMNYRFYHLAGLLLIVLSLGACGSHVYHYVKKGETLYSISFQYGQDYRDLAYWNLIKPPYRIYPHQRLRVSAFSPDELQSLPPITSLSDEESPARVQQTSPKERHAVRQPTTPSSVTRSPPITHTPTVPPSVARSATTAALSWVWPADGKLVRTFSGNDSSRKGLDISGYPGAPVRAAANGHVVYSGGGLVRYGNLIIIKHNENFLSAYAHNRKLLVKEGQRVRAGEFIAEMGNTGTDRVMLHFEIRRNGDPVDPLHYLPMRG